MDYIIIKNMVCPRCIEAVKDIFQEIEISIINIRLGKVSIKEEISSGQKQLLKERLARKGFELLDDKHTQLINQIKSIIIREVHQKEGPSPVNFSTLISEKLNHDYAYLSRLFSSVEGRTLEKFILSQKIEKVKELITYDELTLSEIAYQLHYSSPAHLSAQFKKITGMSPSSFRKMQVQERRFLDEV